MASPAALPERPGRATARLDAPLSRWLLLVKWILTFPHRVMLFLLGIAFTAVSVIAFLALVRRAPAPIRTRRSARVRNPTTRRGWKSPATNGRPVRRPHDSRCSPVPARHGRHRNGRLAEGVP